MKARILLGFTAAVAAALTAISIQVPGATAAVSHAADVGLAKPAASHPVLPDVNSKALSSWQTDNTVWAVAYTGGVVYAGGQFDEVRPPGEAAGSTTGQVGRTFLAAFNSTTGALISSFSPEITGTAANAGVYSLAVSPDGQTLYVGGLFDHVDGQYRDNLAAFSTATGALTSWAPSAYGKVTTIVLSPQGDSIYLGGSFSELDAAPRTYAGAVAPDGTLLPWAPVVDNSVNTIAVDPDDSQVLIGGYFQTLNGAPEVAAGAVDPVDGTTNYAWDANIVPSTKNCNPPAVKDIVISAGMAYLSSEGTGSGCFDGDFAVQLGNVAASGSDQLLWQNDCLGATQALVVIKGYLFKGSHAHDCAYAPGGFPEVPYPTGFWVTHRLLDQSLTDGSLGHWNPDTNATLLGPRAMTTDGSRLFLGGDFTTVNGKAQQGFAIFPSGAESTRPPTPAKPTVTSTAAGVASVSFPAVSTTEFGTLTYTIYRSGVTAPVGTVTATSWPWALPVVHYRVTGLRAGKSVSFSVMVGDGTRNSVLSPVSAPVTVSATTPKTSYDRTVLYGKPNFLWELDQTSGDLAVDASPNRFDGSYGLGTAKGVAGPITGSGDTATAFNGSSSGIVSALSAIQAPQTFSIEGWFKTSTNTGGEIVGFGASKTGSSKTFDRQIYMMNDGQLVFGVQTTQKETIETPNAYNDGKWHYVVATFSSKVTSDNMALYVDGQQVSVQTTTGAVSSYLGYWRLGGGNLNGWNLDHWRSNSQKSTEPNSYFLSGDIGDVAIYSYALTPLRVAAHYAANALSH